MRITERFAASGYLAIAPALFTRGNTVACIVRTFNALSSGMGVALDDCVAARDHLVADRRCSGRVGMVGFCMGGGLCLVLAPRGIFDASAPNYADWPKDQSALSNSCPTVASYGARDRILKRAADRLESFLAEGDVPCDIKEYPEVGHCFMNDLGTRGPLKLIQTIAHMRYSEPEAEDAWRRILAFFGEHLS